MVMDGGIIKDVTEERSLTMPNKKAKERKRKKRLLNIKLKSQGRTANQVKRKKLKRGDSDGRRLY